MVYIKKIVLQGFKSFNKKIAIPFVKGLNIIVGPNGSGKSNIVDAICFVLGKISAKALRANRLSELIFKGGNGKKPAEIASVTLYLDNSNKILQNFDEEIIITRKVNKKGYTLYKLNGKTVTREKILEVLSRVNLRPDGFNIIFQGDVTRIIEMSPLQRREIIDEISGIYEYNEKKERAMKDLEKVEQKLREIEIIVNQKYEQFKKLEEQRNAVLKYRQLEKRLKILKYSFYAKKIEILKDEIQKIEEEIQKFNSEIQKIKQELENVEKEIEEKEKNLKEIVKKILKVSKKFEKESEASKIRAEILVLKSKLENNKAEIQRLRNLVEKLSQLEQQNISEEEIPLSVKTILDLNIKGIYGTIADLMRVDEKYELAIQVAAANHLFDIVVESFDVAKYCIEFLKREKIGRATFLPLDKIKPKVIDERFLEKDGVIGRASDLIKYDKKFEKAFEFVFGNTLVIKSLDYAKNIGIGKVRMVTLDGDLIERSGAITGGYLVKKSRVSLKKSYKKEIDEYLKSIAFLESENQTLEKQIKELENKLKKLKIDESEKLEIDLKVESEKELERLRKRRKVLLEKRISLQTKISNLRVRKAKIEAEIENLLAEAEEYKIDESLIIKNKSLEELKNLIHETLSEIRSLGPINFKAVDEYEKIKKDFEVLKQKFDKVMEEKNSILKMIDEIEQKRKEVFFSTLREVSFFFNQTFHQLTNGSAEIELEDPENLESGLLIKASYPGKPMIDIDGMSGGEKSLVAIAFLFALQKLRPTPFYVLDEIDAALDKENAEKVGKFLKEIAKHSQIILITHNDIIVKYADTLYGVTMVDGESKIVGLELPR